MTARTALVTGASRGIGRATAAELHARGWTVIATARDPRSLDGLAVAERAALDVTDDASVAAVAARWGAVDLLVNNAGIGAAGPVESTPTAVARKILDVNVLGPLRMVGTVGAAMRRAGQGTIVMVSSLVGRVAPPLTGVYAASKFALEGLSDALAVELGHFGVRVVLVEPGFVSTGAFEAFRVHLPSDPEAYAPLAEHVAAAGRQGGGSTPEEVAAAIADAAERDDPPRRIPVGPAATGLLAARAAADEGYDALVRETFTPAGWSGVLARR